MTRIAQGFLMGLIFSFATVDLWAQRQDTYTVIKVSGRVLSAVANREIRTGDVVKTSDKLIFETRNAYVHVINSDGRKTIRNIPDNSPRELTQLMQGYLSPDKAHRGSRGANAQGLEIVIHQLSYDTILILGNGRVAINTTETTLKKPAGVAASFLRKDEKVGRVISDESGFNLGRQFLLGLSVEAPYPKVSLIYCEDIKDPVFSPSVYLGAFVPMYVDEAVLQKELLTMTELLKRNGKSPAQIEQEITSYLSNEYATPIQDNVQDWLKANGVME